MLQLKIVSPEKVVFQGEVESVLVPGTLGSFEILNEVEYTTKEGKQTMNINGGFVECKKNEVSLCVEV